jgi:hypothetical protein
MATQHTELINYLKEHPLNGHSIDPQVYQKYLEKATTLEGLYQFVMINPKAERPKVMVELYNAGYYDPTTWDISKWWEFLIFVWSVCSEWNLKDNPDDWKTLYRLVPTIKALTKELPKGKFKIYRGAIQITADGHSWSLSKKQAEWFASRNEDLFELKHKVYEKTITKDDVLWYDNSYRNEQEVVLKSILA